MDETVLVAGDARVAIAAIERAFERTDDVRWFVILMDVADIVGRETFGARIAQYWFNQIVADRSR